MMRLSFINFTLNLLTMVRYQQKLSLQPYSYHAALSCKIEENCLLKQHVSERI